MFAKFLIGAAQQSFFRCFIFLACLSITFSILSPHFLSFTNLDNILSATAVTGLLALGVTFVISSGGIDLSVASLMALAGTLSACLLQDTALGNSILALPAAVFICLLCGGSCGALTGWLTNISRAPSFIVTLGMLSVFRAIAYIIAGGTPVYGLPPALTAAGQGRFLGISIPVVILLLASALAYYILHFTKFGIQALVYGDNPFAAEAMGVQVERVKMKVFAICGAFAGLSGFVFMARTNAGDPTAGQNYELVAITAVVLGGAKLFGGQANVLGTLLGVLCLGVLQNGLNLLAVSTYYQVLFVGLVLLSAAMLERVSTKT